MFNGLRKGSLFYILSKGENPSLKIGQVTEKSDPKPKNNTTPIQQYGFAPTVVDITVQCGDETYNFDGLDSEHTIRYYPEKNVVISDNREQMLTEVETMVRTSRQILESVPYHEEVAQSGEEMILRLNPQLAREKEQEEKIGTLENKISGVEKTLSNIQEMIAEALSVRSGSSRKSNDK